VSVMISRTNLSGLANMVKAKTLTRIGSGKRVRSGLGRVTGLMLFP
jgi:hypothetical protein